MKITKGKGLHISAPDAEFMKLWNSAEVGETIDLAPCEKVSEPNQRTLTQNKALHLFCELLAECLNDAGYDMKRVLDDDFDIPWTQATVKEHLFKPLQKVMLNKGSTTEANTTDYNAVYTTLSRHLGQKLGITCPQWPSRFNQGE